jgi:hypothetical protein
VPVDRTYELSQLLFEHKYEEVVTASLQRSNVSIVSWDPDPFQLQRTGEEPVDGLDLFKGIQRPSTCHVLKKRKNQN